jgi:hypothetical protein
MGIYYFSVNIVPAILHLPIRNKTHFFLMDKQLWKMNITQGEIPTQYYY